MRKEPNKCGPAVGRLGCRVSIKMASQPCGSTIPNKPTLCMYSLINTGTNKSPSAVHIQNTTTDTINR